MAGSGSLPVEDIAKAVSGADSSILSKLQNSDPAQQAVAKISGS